MTHHDTDARNMEVLEKKEAGSPVEHTRPGLVFTPEVDIFETEQNITVLADMPGVDADDLTIDLRDNTLTLLGEVQVPENTDEAEVLREYNTGRYYRQFTVSNAIDQEKITADLANGVLRLTLPKVAAAQPRKIQVRNSG